LGGYVLGGKMKYKTLIKHLIEIAPNPNDEIRLEMWADGPEELNFKRFLFDIDSIENNYEVERDPNHRYNYPTEDIVIRFNLKSCKQYKTEVRRGVIENHQFLPKEGPGTITESFKIRKKCSLQKELNNWEENNE